MRLIKKVRQKFYSFFAFRVVAEKGENCKANSRCHFTRKTHLGYNCNFNGCTINGNGCVTIGNNFHSGAGLKMITTYHNYDKGEQIPYDGTNIDKDIRIGDQVWIGTDVLILGGVTIGEGAVIQAGSVVVFDIPACAVAGGNPAQVFKIRDEEHYYELKKAQKFR